MIRIPAMILGTWWILTPIWSQEPLTLTEDAAVQRLLTRSHRITAADAWQQAATSTLESARAQQWPTVTWFSDLGQRSAVPELSAPLDGPGQPLTLLFPNIQTTFKTGIQAQYQLYTSGGRNASIRAAQSNQRATEFQEHLVRADLRWIARLAFWNAVQARAQLDHKLAQLRRAQTLVADTQAMFDAGMAVNADILAAEARAAAARVGVVNAETRMEETRIQLCSLLQYPIHTQFAFQEEDLNPPPPNHSSLEEWLVIARQTRPELETLRARCAALDAQQTQVRSLNRPRVSLDALAQVARPNPAIMPLEDVWNDNWAIQLRGTWRLFDGQRTRCEADALAAQADALAAEEREMLRSIELDVRINHQQWQSSHAGLDAAKASLQAARARLQATEARKEAGLATVADLLDAQQDLAAAELQMVEARTALHLAWARLARAVGR